MKEYIINCVCKTGIDWIQLVGVVVAAVIPVIVMGITLRREKRFHNEQIKQIHEKNRIDALPVFELSGITVLFIPNLSASYKCPEPIDRMTAIIDVKNSGNGTAINVSINNELDDNGGVVPVGASSIKECDLYRDSKKNVFIIRVTYMDLYKNYYCQELYYNAVYEGSCRTKNMGATCPRLL